MSPFFLLSMQANTGLGSSNNGGAGELVFDRSTQPNGDSWITVRVIVGTKEQPGLGETKKSHVSKKGVERGGGGRNLEEEKTVMLLRLGGDDHELFPSMWI